MNEDIRADVCFFKPSELSLEEASEKLSIKIYNYPQELFAFIDFEDIEKNKYFITSYGRIFTSYGRELFPENYSPPEQNNIYLRIELSCSGYIKRRKFFVHRLVANAFIPKTSEDIQLNRDIVNHKFNKDGRCNYVWNLEWTNTSENTLHGLYFSEPYDSTMFNYNIITDRKDIYLSYDQFGDKNPKSKISEFQAHLICHAYTNLGFSLKECAEYAWLEPNQRNLLIVQSIVYGYSWNHIGKLYGITPKPKRENIKRANPIRPEKKDEYYKLRKSKRR